MLTLERHGYRAPFPRLPASAETEAALDGLSLRAFGLFRYDLEIDFDQDSRPRLVTQILQCCTTNKYGEPPDQGFFWDLTIGKRIECLLTIATLDSSGLNVRLRCSNDACLQEMELEISLGELASIQHPIDDTDRFVVQIGDESLPVRKPTGRDQLNWLETPFSDEDAAVRTMVQTLLLERAPSSEEGPIPDEWVRHLNRTMEEHDPLVNFIILVPCPYCETENRCEIDLQELSLDVLHRDQLRLLEAVHRFALRYHWSEEQIFSLPPWRFYRYLALIEEEESR